MLQRWKLKIVCYPIASRLEIRSPGQVPMSKPPPASSPMSRAAPPILI